MIFRSYVCIFDSVNLRKTYIFKTTISFMSTRNRTPSQIISYGLYLYFLGFSFRSTAKALSFSPIIKISHISIWKWLQKYRSKKYFKKRKIKEYVIDETVIKAGSELVWIWVVIEPTKKKKFFHFIYQKSEICIC